MDEFSERWRLPDSLSILHDWLADLAVIGESCSCPGGYHRVWSMIKLAGRHLGLIHDAPLIRDVAGPLLASASRVLIAGSADRLALRLLGEIGGAGASHHFTLVDRCAAPLHLARAEAECAGVNLATLQQDIGNTIALAQPANLIFGHYVLNFFDPAQRRDALRAFKAALAPEGRIVLAQRSAASVMPLAPAPWVEANRTRIAKVLPPEHEAWPLIDELLRGYAPHRGWRRMPPFAEFEADLAHCGLAVLATHPTGREATLSDEHRIEIPDDKANLYVLGHG